jgi:hypothetical protein
MASLSIRAIRFGGVLGLALILGLSFARTADAAPPPGPGEQPPVRMELGSFGIDRFGAILFTGTLTCTQDAEVVFSDWISQEVGARTVTAGATLSTHCAVGQVIPVSLAAAPADGRFVPGEVWIGLELEYWTTTSQGNMIGFVPWDLQRIRTKS